LEVQEKVLQHWLGKQRLLSILKPALIFIEMFEVKIDSQHYKNNLKTNDQGRLVLDR
jgi:hypothetical protein